MKKLHLFLPVALLALLGSCATIVSKSVYPVRIDSSPQKATIVITNKKGVEIFNGTTPVQVDLKSGAGYFKKAIYSITYKKEGYLDKTIDLSADINGWYFGNLVFGGLIGMLVVDPATGAMFKINDTSINETLAPATATSKADGLHKLQVYDINEIPQEWKKNLQEIRVK